MSKKVYGQAVIRVDGASIDHAGKATLMTGGTKRDPVQADNKAGFFTTTTVPASLEFDALVTDDFDAVAAQAYENVTVSIEFDTGQAYVIRGGYTGDEVSTSDGKAKIKMYGEPAELVS